MYGHFKNRRHRWSSQRTMGQEADPIVGILWGLLQFLDNDERQWTKTFQLEGRGETETVDESEGEFNLNIFESSLKDYQSALKHDVTDFETPYTHWNEECKRPSLPVPFVPTPDSLDFKSSYMHPARSISDQQRALCPAHTVSSADVLPSDQQGWLTDQIRGLRVWCAVVSLHFCVFETEDAAMSKQVVYLPGCNVRRVEFKTPTWDDFRVNGVNIHSKSNSTLGVDKFQFWLENGASQNRFMFGVSSKTKLDQWMKVLIKSTSIDPETIGCHQDLKETISRMVYDGGGREEKKKEEIKENNTHINSTKVRVEGTQEKSKKKIQRNDENSEVDHAVINDGSKITRVNGGHKNRVDATVSARPARKINELSRSLRGARDVGKESVDEIRRKLRREPDHASQEKSVPLRASYPDPSAAEPSPTPDTTTRSRARSLFKASGLDSLFRGKRRSASADDAVGRKPLKDSKTSGLRSLTPSPDQSLERKRPAERLGREAGWEGEMDSGSEQSEESGQSDSLSRSWRAKDKSSSLGASIRKTASGLRVKLFNSAHKVRLCDLGGATLQGYLRFKTSSRWTRLWTVLCRGCLYGFQSNKAKEVPLMVLVLPRCSVTYVPDSEPLTVKLTQPNSSDLYLSAESQDILTPWMLALQRESCKMLGDIDFSSCTDDSNMNCVRTAPDCGSDQSIDCSRVAVDSHSPRDSFITSHKSTSQSWDTRSLTLSVEASDVSFEHDLSSPSSQLHLHSEGDLISASESGDSHKSERKMHSLSRWRSLTEVFKTKRQRSVLNEGSLHVRHFHSDTENVHSYRPTESQASSLRHDEALTHVWNKDRGYLFQLIKSKLQRRKRRMDSSGENGHIYNLELPHAQGGLLIQHDTGSSEQVFFDEVRQRSRSFTEGKPVKATSTSLHSGWRSSPATPQIPSDNTRKRNSSRASKNIQHDGSDSHREPVTSLTQLEENATVLEAPLQLGKGAVGKDVPAAIELSRVSGVTERPLCTSHKSDVSHSDALNPTGEACEPETVVLGNRSVGQFRLSDISIPYIDEVDRISLPEVPDNDGQERLTDTRFVVSSEHPRVYTAWDDYDAGEDGSDSTSNSKSISKPLSSSTTQLVREDLSIQTHQAVKLKGPQLTRANEGLRLTPNGNSHRMHHIAEDSQFNAQQAETSGALRPRAVQQQITHSALPRISRGSTDIDKTVECDQSSVTQPSRSGQSSVDSYGYKESFSRVLQSGKEILLGHSPRPPSDYPHIRANSCTLSESSKIPLTTESSKGARFLNTRESHAASQSRITTRSSEDSRKQMSQGRDASAVQLAAQHLTAAVMHGYLFRRTLNEKWLRYWYVLQDGCLYCYLTRDDPVTVDVTDLEGYYVTSLVDKFPGHRFVIHLKHEDYIPVHLSVTSREEMEEWHTALTAAVKHARPRLASQESCNQESGATAGRISEERVLSIKQKLLAEVLRQKEELEKQQAARLASKKQSSLEEDHVSSSQSSIPTPTGEQICTLTRLRQRRMSTQIKMDTLQRQITSNGHKKSRFHFGKKKGDDPQAAHNPEIVQQLKTLSHHLSEIDRDLVQNGGIMTLDRKFIGQRQRKLQLGQRHSFELESGNPEYPAGTKTQQQQQHHRPSSLEVLSSDELGVSRSNSLKSSMQKLAHRTFAKAGWSKSKKIIQSNSLDREYDKSEERSDAGNNNNNNSPDVIDLSHHLHRTWPFRAMSDDSMAEDDIDGHGIFVPPPLSFDSDDSSLAPSPRSADSSYETYSDSNRRLGNANYQQHSLRRDRNHNSTLPKSGRRQVDPSAMAEIEAFEEMSRQILGEEPT